MKSSLLLFSIAIIAFISFAQNAEAQHGLHILLNVYGTINYCNCNLIHPPPLPDFEPPPPFTSSGKIVLNCNTPIAGDSLGCASFDTSGGDSVSYSIGATVYNLDGFTFMTNNLVLTNNTSCNENFTVCQMVQYNASHKDQNVPDSVNGGEPFKTFENQWTLTQHICGTCSTGCDWTCSDDTGFLENYWSYYFGCEDVNLAPGQSKAIFPGTELIDGPILAWRGTDPAHHINTLRAAINSTDPLNSFNRQGVYEETANGAVSLTTFNDQAYIAWAGTDTNHYLNIMALPLV